MGQALGLAQTSGPSAAARGQIYNMMLKSNQSTEFVQVSCIY